jgi:glyoxylate reductase
MKLLSLLDLPGPVEQVFRSRLKLINGTLDRVVELNPDALLTSIGVTRLDEQEIGRLPSSVKAIATYSVGLDHIDLTAAAERQIAVFNTPGVLGDAVADAAMLLILGAARRVTESVSLLREGRWRGWSPIQLLGVGLAGKMLGILGMGDIGRRVAIRARGFGMQIAYHNRRRLDDEDALYLEDPRSVVAESDILLLAWPSVPETRRFIAAGTLALAKPNLILINIGRGDLVEDSDLIASLRDRRILAAGLDVFDGEPSINPAYLELPNAFLLPHIGSSTWEARIAMAQVLVDALEAHIAGRMLANRVV